MYLKGAGEGVGRVREVLKKMNVFQRGNTLITKHVFLFFFIFSEDGDTTLNFKCMYIY